MATSWAKEEDENVNYTKLCRLLYDGGTLAVKTAFDGIVTPANLSTVLTNKKHILQKLKKPTGKVLSQDQWNLLYPPSGAVPNSNDFDITLLFVLLRNICGLTPPCKGWNALPAPSDPSLEAQLVKIKHYRNNVVAHCTKAEASDTDFETYWNSISGALVSLGLKQDDIDDLKASPLGEKNYNFLVESWHLYDEDIKHQLDTIKSETLHLKTIKSDTLHLKTVTSKIESSTTEIKCALESMVQNTSMTNEVDKLAHIDYSMSIKNNCKKHHPSTRQWLLDQVDKHVKQARSEAGAVLIRAGAGMGKSVVAATICQIYQNNGLLGGCHFFQHNDRRRNNPRIMLQSIAHQLCKSVPGYQAALENMLKTLQGRNISDLNCEELFGLLFEESLGQINIDHNVVIVIDALDECTSQFKEEIEDVLKNKLPDLPSWIRFIITTRPLPSCNIKRADVIEIIESDQRNKQDIKTYLDFELVKQNREDLTLKLVHISNGLFLVAYFLIDILKESKNKSIPNVLDCFPDGISSVYKHYFKRIESLIKPYLDTTQSKSTFYKMLEAVVASDVPIPKAMFYEILHLKSEEDIPPEKIEERNDAVHLLHTIFPVENDHVTVFHKTVTDWLSHKKDNTHQFSVSESNGIEVLAEKCLDVLKALKERPTPALAWPVLSNSEKFSVRYGTLYIIKSCRLNEHKIEEVVKDITVVAIILSEFSQLFYPLLNLKGSGTNYCKSPVKEFLFYLITLFYYGTAQLLAKDSSFHFFLSLAGNLLLNNRSSPLTQSPLEKVELHCWLEKNKLPHYSFHYVCSHLPVSCRSSNLFQIEKGFVITFSFHNDQALTVLNIKDDGKIGEQKTFTFDRSNRVIGVSPDKKYLIITIPNSIRLYDVTTLEKLKEYSSPLDQVYSYHIFGDAKQWYIAVRAEDGQFIYILDGLNGHLDSKIRVENCYSSYEIITVSLNGNILIRHNDSEYYNIPFRNVQDSVKLKQIPSLDHTNYSNYRVSDDGKVFAILNPEIVIVYDTKDGSLYRMLDVNLLFNPEIVFLTSSSLIVHFNDGVRSELYFYDLVSNKLIYYAQASLRLIKSSLLVVPCQDGDKVIPALYGLTEGVKLVKLEFHCLEQYFLGST